MENNLKQTYYNKANDLFSRLMDEADEPETEATPEGGADEAPAEPEDTQEPEVDETQPPKPFEIFWRDLNEEAQERLVESLKPVLKATEEDTTSEEKIKEALSKSPKYLVSVVPEEIKTKLGIKI